MGRKKIEQDLRDAGLRKKRARKLTRTAEQARSGDRAARRVIEQRVTALRDSISAVVGHAKAPTKKSAQRTSAKKRPATRQPAKKQPAKKQPTRKPSNKTAARKRTPAPRSASRSVRKAPTKKTRAS